MSARRRNKTKKNPQKESRKDQKLHARVRNNPKFVISPKRTRQPKSCASQKKSIPVPMQEAPNYRAVPEVGSRHPSRNVEYTRNPL